MSDFCVHCHGEGYIYIYIYIYIYMYVCIHTHRYMKGLLSRRRLTPAGLARLRSNGCQTRFCLRAERSI